MAAPAFSVATRVRLRLQAGALSITAGVAHGLVAPEHLREWWGYGLFFAVAALGQVFYGGLLLTAPWSYDETGGRVEKARAERSVALVGIVANSAVILLYVVTRTVGVPFLGPAAGEVEPLGPGGVVTSLFEAVLVGLLVALRRPPAGR